MPLSLSPAQALALAARLRAEAGEPDPPTVPKAVCVKLERAEEDLRVAMQICRDNGNTETADDIKRIFGQLRVFTMKDGWLDFLGVPR